MLSIALQFRLLTKAQDTKRENFIEVYPAKSNGIQTVWRWGKEEKARKNLNIEIFGKNNRNGGYMIVQKYRKSVRMQRSIWDDKEFVNERGSEILKEILTQNIFSYPKSLHTIKRVLELGTNTNFSYFCKLIPRELKIRGFYNCQSYKICAIKTQKATVRLKKIQSDD